MNNSKWFLGIDIGSVTTKVALIDENEKVFFKKYTKHGSTPLIALKSVLNALNKNLPKGCTRIKAAVTGSGRQYSKEILGIPAFNEIIAQAIAAVHLYPSVKTIIEIGGQDSKFIKLGESNTTRGINILAQKMNDICAAGTGAFVEQQAERMCLSLEEFSNLAIESKKPAYIAGRCAVFSKSDIVHLQQEGVSKSDISAGVCNAVVRNYIAQFLKGKKLDTPVIFQGGLAANKGVTKAFMENLKLSTSAFIIAENFEVMGAIGAAISVMSEASAFYIEIDELINKLDTFSNNEANKNISMGHVQKLQTNIKRLKPLPQSINCNGSKLYVGIDVGSTSTCIAVIDDKKNLVTKKYVFNKGNLIKSVNDCLSQVFASGKELGVKRIAGIGVTGSGRYLVGKFVGADSVKDEISAQAVAAAFLYPQVDTVIEIGGQDSKFIRINSGRVIDFEMNKVCAAGTGYFLQEQAEKMNVEVSSLSNLAFKSSNPCDLGARCTVFMESDLINYQQFGIRKENLSAGLSYAIAKNYLEKVVAGKQIGKKVLFLGGVAFNESVVSAFQQLLDKELLIPEHHEVSAALGMALIAKKEMSSVKKGSKSKFVGIDKLVRDFDQEHFQCKGCTNNCMIGKVTFNNDNGSFFYGGICGKYDKKVNKRKLPNIFEQRNELLLSYLKPKSNSNLEQIGIPRAHLFFDKLPLYCTFLQELGFEVVLSEETNMEIAHDALERTAIDNCYASKLVYGHVNNLISKNVKRIFLPSVTEFERKVKDFERNYSCPHVQGVPALIKYAFTNAQIISPNIYRDGSDQDWKKELKLLGIELGASPSIAGLAVKKAESAQQDFRKKCENIGKKFLENNKEEKKICVVMGKVYNVCDPGLNMNLVKKLLEHDVVPLPYDCLPISEQELPLNYVDMVWESGQDLIRAAKVIFKHKNVFPVIINNFGCGPDSFIVKYMEEIFKEKAYLLLEVDEHTSDVGFNTRVEAFLNSLEVNESKDFKDFKEVTEEFKPFLASGRIKKFEKLLYIPWGFDSFRAIASAFSSVGIRTKMLPYPDEVTEKYARQFSSGCECLPYIMHVGDVVRMTKDSDFDPKNSAILIPGSDLACRVSLFSTAMKFVLRDLGYPEVEVIGPRISMDKDETMSLMGVKFTRNLLRGVLSVELLARRVPEIRPYEKNIGETDKIYAQSLNRICTAIEKGVLENVLEDVLKDFDAIEVDKINQRPIIGLVGDDYTRGNSYANNNFVKQIEATGGEVRTIPIWSTYFEFQMGMKPIRSFKKGNYVEFLMDKFKAVTGHRDLQKIIKLFENRLQCFPDPSFNEMLETTSKYVDDRTEPIVIMALSHADKLVKSGIHGLANIVGFQCMIHSIVGGQLSHIIEQNESVPYLTLSLDFQEKVHHSNRIEAFMYQVNQYKRAKEHANEILKG